MIPDKKIANAVSGKTARACDCCIRKRARWYCAADDAFLCQTCDGSVHSANPLARRHQRVRLKTASLDRSDDLPTWQRGLTRKPRTPRHGKFHHHVHHSHNTVHGTVPDLGTEDTTSSHEGETEEQLLYRVPVFDPFVDGSSSGLVNSTSTPQDGYLQSDMDLEEFAADVETLLGKGLDEDQSYGIEELGLFINNDFGNAVKEEDGLGVLNDDVAIREPLDLRFDIDDHNDHDFAATCEEDHDEKEMMIESLREECKSDVKEEVVEKKRRKILLRLDYEAISAAWASQGTSPWMNGQRPEIHPDDSWPHYMGASEIEIRHILYGDDAIGGVGGNGGIGDGGREARVLRYKEKRRTRLFSKKIRYEVRKLNAEKRPRMKGRFVKRSSFTSSATPFPLLSK